MKCQPLSGILNREVVINSSELATGTGLEIISVSGLLITVFRFIHADEAQRSSKIFTKLCLKKENNFLTSDILIL